MNNTNSITECLNQVILLTKKNLEILKALNDAFYTKKGHLAVVVNDDTYVIPSFLSLESRIESLENNIQNIVDAPLTGEAFTYHDGTTQKIELSGYSTTPNHVDLSTVTSFDTETNHIFKDFMSPNPYVKLDIASIPNNIKHVNVRKITIPENATAIINTLASIAIDGVVSYSDMVRVLYGYTEGVDYTSYDKIYRLPIREGVAQGDYEILNIIDNYNDSNFDEYYELELDRSPVYYINNGTLQKTIRVGDNLVTYNDKVMMEVTNVNTVTNTITVKVLYGAYADLQDRTSGNPALYKLKYYKSNTDLSATKYINVPLEEDRYVVIFIAPLNDTTNTQAPWGDGIYIDVDTLVIPDPNDPSSTIGFREYYDTYVNNVGDALMGITSMMDDDEQVSRLNQTHFQILKDLQPIINDSIINVTQINKHLNDTKSIKAIRNLYAQKTQYKNELEVVQRNIDQVNKNLSELSFDDTTNSRTIYETQLSDYNVRKSKLINSINGILQEISVNANNSETPIENAKYHIRGFINTALDSITTAIPSFVKVIKIDVEYRYRNKSNFTGNASTYSDDGTTDNTYIFSDWNKMTSIYRKRIPEFINNNYTYEWEEDNGGTNNPSYNQIDIPITQGEIVDIRVRFIYNLGYPFVEMRSAWSDIYTQEFPAEYTENVEVLDIIAENNDEIKSRHFENILIQQGVIRHLDDQLQDQTILYKHKAEDITSGFLTQERRVIPLSDKLFDFNEAIEDLRAEVFGATSQNLIVTLGDMDNTVQLKPYIINNISVQSYTTAKNAGNIFTLGTGTNAPIMAIAQMVLNIYNNGSYITKLHSIFPGDYTSKLTSGQPSQFVIDNYAELDSQGNPSGRGVVAMSLDDTTSQDSNNPSVMYQRYNQWLYFRNILTDISGTPDLYTILSRHFSYTPYIVTNDGITNGIPNNKLIGEYHNIVNERMNQGDITNLTQALTNSSASNARFGVLYPYPGTVSAICIPSDQSYTSIAPGESISIPINFVYWFKDQGTGTQVSDLTISRAMAFDIRTSLYHDPITFKFVVNTSYTNTREFELRREMGTTVGLSPLNSTVEHVGAILPQSLVNFTETPIKKKLLKKGL